MGFDVPLEDQRDTGPSTPPIMHLPRDDRSVKAVRDEVANTLQEAGWSHAAVERARVVASELATNALVHAGTEFELEVRLEPGAHQVWIGVTDEAADSLPRYAERDVVRPGGMGLYLVDAMAVSWGMRPGSHGKVVWACLADD
jgi:anti-sigma regulatory factor (Ser/Thr protein kinase)